MHQAADLLVGRPLIRSAVGFRDKRWLMSPPTEQEPPVLTELPDSVSGEVLRTAYGVLRAANRGNRSAELALRSLRPREEIILRMLFGLPPEGMEEPPG